MVRYFTRVRDNAQPYRAITYDTHWEETNVTPIESVRALIDEWRDKRFRNERAADEDLIARLTPVFERAQRWEPVDEELGLLRERAERAEAERDVAFSQVANCKAAAVSARAQRDAAEADVKRLREALLDCEGHAHVCGGDAFRPCVQVLK